MQLCCQWTNLSISLSDFWTQKTGNYWKICLEWGGRIVLKQVLFNKAGNLGKQREISVLFEEKVTMFPLEARYKETVNNKDIWGLSGLEIQK